MTEKEISAELGEQARQERLKRESDYAVAQILRWFVANIAGWYAIVSAIQHPSVPEGSLFREYFRRAYFKPLDWFLETIPNWISARTFEGAGVLCVLAVGVGIFHLWGLKEPGPLAKLSKYAVPILFYIPAIIWWATMAI